MIYAISRSRLLKLTLFICGFLLMPVLAEGKTLSFEDQTWEIDSEAASYAPWVSVRNDFDLYQVAKAQVFNSKTTDTVPLFSRDAVATISAIALEVTQPTREPKMVIKDGRAVNFDPGHNGQAIDLYALRLLLLADNQTAALPVIKSWPEAALADTNSLGINELVAVGESDFTGSPRNRVHNITVGAKKFDGIIIAPNQEFSFNENLGDVDGEHGFLPELVIKASGVIPEFGGGLCQVSSTTFRAAMNAGLPITARRNHSFAVQYYAPQGTDATIYPGSSDFKFVNNLSSSLLIHTKIVGRKLYFEFYGTKDSRSIAFDGPVQYDKKTDGSMKATWTRHVTANGETTTQTFNSTYQPPALFHPTEQTSTPNPQSPPETTPPPDSPNPPQLP